MGAWVTEVVGHQQSGTGAAYAAGPAGDQPAGSLMRAVMILRSVAGGGRSGVSLSELVEWTGLPRPTIHRVCQMLQEIGWLERVEANKRFFLGVDLAALAISAQLHHPLETLAHPTLDRLSVETGQAFYLSVRSGNDVVCVARCESGAQVRMLIVEVGTRLALGIGSAGMAILAALRDEEQHQVLASNRKRYMQSLSYDEDAFREELRLTRERQFARHDGIFARGMSGIGVPVCDASGYPLAAISTAFITASLDVEQQKHCAAMMREGAKEVAMRLTSLTGLNQVSS